MKLRRRHGIFLLLSVAVIGVLLSTALAPLNFASREAFYEIPNGTWARRMAGDPINILPDTIYLTLGAQDILVLKNQDDVPQIFGPTLIMPGQSFKLPFELASEYLFVCSAHASGQMTVIVDPLPVSGWTRLQWRIKSLWRVWL
jgi:hypothetical protein